MTLSYEISIYRINTIIALFSAKRACYSVSDVAKLLQVPSAIIRKDFRNLHTNREYGITFFSKDMDDERFESVIENLDTGDYDEIEFMAYTDEICDVSVVLTPTEYTILDEFLDGELYGDMSGALNYVTKPYYSQAKASMQVLVEELQKLIDEDKSIKIHYKTREGRIIFVDIHPLAIVHVALDDIYYVVTVYNDKISSFRVDGIKHFDVLDENVEAGNRELLKLLPNMWGMEIGEPQQVKIFIKDEGNVVRKVKRDLTPRIHGKWSEVPGGYIFEDEVIGLNSFKNWVFSYGSSVVVLEPMELRQSIIDSAKRRLNQ